MINNIICNLINQTKRNDKDVLLNIDITLRNITQGKCLMRID